MADGQMVERRKQWEPHLGTSSGVWLWQPCLLLPDDQTFREGRSCLALMASYWELCGQAGRSRPLGSQGRVDHRYCRFDGLCHWWHFSSGHILDPEDAYFCTSICNIYHVTYQSLCEKSMEKNQVNQAHQFGAKTPKPPKKTVFQKITLSGQTWYLSLASVAALE